MERRTDQLLVLLGNHLFPPGHTDDLKHVPVFMAEDLGLCTYVRHHQHKIVLFLAAMRSHADELQKRGRTVHYTRLDDRAGDAPYENKLLSQIKASKTKHLITFEVEDKFMEKRLKAFADRNGLQLTFRRSPMFLTSRDQFMAYLEGAGGRPHMAGFYADQRKRLNLLMTANGKPRGGKWSFDDENRRKLPESVAVPEVGFPAHDKHTTDVIKLVQQRFGEHPGDADSFWLPTTRRQALRWLRCFLEERFEMFGPYEDAISQRSPFLFHSVLSPLINIGLITPDEVVERAVEFADEHGIPMNSLEGFVRQVIGWREFVRGIYQRYSQQQDEANFFDHHRKLKDCWRTGATGLPPLDDAIRKAQDWGWTHHIERLMIIGNLMTLCEIEPRECFRWFMEMYVDSSDWVMGPNVYGMGVFSDGGVFATKPYICGSNYIRKMSDYGKGGWCDTMDGLYWRFVDAHRTFFASNPRTAMMVRSLDRLNRARKDAIFKAAEAFLDRVTDG